MGSWSDCERHPAARACQNRMRVERETRRQPGTLAMGSETFCANAAPGLHHTLSRDPASARPHLSMTRSPCGGTKSRRDDVWWRGPGDGHPFVDGKGLGAAHRIDARRGEPVGDTRLGHLFCRANGHHRRRYGPGVPGGGAASAASIRPGKSNSMMSTAIAAAYSVVSSPRLASTTSEPWLSGS